MGRFDLSIRVGSEVRGIERSRFEPWPGSLGCGQPDKMLGGNLSSIPHSRFILQKPWLTENPCAKLKS